MDVREVSSKTGDGFVWDEHNVVTSNHVIGIAPAVRVTLVDADGNSMTHKASMRVRNTDKDIAVVKLEGNTTAPAVERALSSELRVGQTAIAIGNPFGLDYTVTKVIVSGLGRSIGVGAGAGLFNMTQTDASIYPET